LLSNAIELTHDGRIAVAIERGDDGRVSLVVSDTGGVLPPETRRLLGENARRIDDASARRYDAVGLGLGIVKRYTALLRGSLRVDSEPGNGTTITVELPPFGPAHVDAASTRAALRHPPH
jgi:signal transduction histidine kinase